MKIQKNRISSSFGKTNSLLIRGVFVLLFSFLLPSCDLLKSKVKEYLLQFNSADGSIGQVIADGYILIDGQRTDISTSNLLELSVSEEWIRLKIEDGSDTYYLTVPSFNKDYDLVDSYIDDAFTFVKVFYNTIGGIGGVSNFSVEATDTYEGAGEFNLAVVGEIQAQSGGSVKQVVLELNINFDTKRTGGIAGGGGSTGGGSGSTGGSGSGTCENLIDGSLLVSYWGTQITRPEAVSGTGKKVAGNTIFSDYKASDIGLVIDGTKGGTRYVVQIIFTSSLLQANKTIEFKNAGAGTGLTTSGAVGRLIAIKGGINDDWRTNRDYGKNIKQGTLTITTISPKITGTYEFTAYGDGYDNKTNLQKAVVKGKFCIDP